MPEEAMLRINLYGVKYYKAHMSPASSYSYPFRAFDFNSTLSPVLNSRSTDLLIGSSNTNLFAWAWWVLLSHSEIVDSYPSFPRPIPSLWNLSTKHFRVVLSGGRFVKLKKVAGNVYRQDPQR